MLEYEFLYVLQVSKDMMEQGYDAFVREAAAHAADMLGQMEIPMSKESHFLDPDFMKTNDNKKIVNFDMRVLGKYKVHPFKILLRLLFSTRTSTCQKPLI